MGQVRTRSGLSASRPAPRLEQHRLLLTVCSLRPLCPALLARTGSGQAGHGEVLEGKLAGRPH